MSWQIIYDPEAHIAALVDADAPAALGPVAVGSEGEDPRLPLQEFVEGLEDPPDTMATWVLFNEWTAYVRAIVDLVESEVQAAQEPSDGSGASEPTADGVPSPQEAGELATDPPAAPPAPVSPGSDVPVTEEEDQEAAARIAAAPGTPAKAGEEECWMCHGDLQIDTPNGRGTCPVCHGEGKVPADATAS